MYLLFSKRLFAVAMMLTFGLIACKSSDNTIVIEEAPITSSQNDITDRQMDDAFQQLTIGEITPVRSLDPLFADNTASMHGVQLLYEGLVRYDETGEIIPAIAKNWAVSDDKQTYRFTLRDSIFFHDSDIFSNGLGRKLTAADVKFAFERMAKGTVPDDAAQLFMNIEGFEPYYQEQRRVLQPEDRQLKTISGIEVQNDSTISFSLVEPDPQFITKLAVPYAAIYPREAVKPRGFEAVGSGPFKLSQKRNDSLYIFSKFENYRVENQPELNRIDLRTYANSTALAQAINSGEVQLVPQLSPQLMTMYLTSGNKLKEPLTSDLQLLNSEHTITYFVRYHEGADRPRDEVTAALQRVNPIQLFADLPENSVEISWPQTNPSTAQAADSLSTTYTSDPFLTTFYDQLGRKLTDEGIAFDISSSRVANRNIPLFTEAYPLLYDEQSKSPAPLITLKFKAPGLSRTNIENLNFNSLPWWIDLRETTEPVNETR